MTLVGYEVYPLAMELNPNLAKSDRIKITQLIFRLPKINFPIKQIDNYRCG